jgi:hypothetical protein
VRSARLAAKGDVGGQARPAPGDAVHLERPPDGLDPVGEAPQARAARGVLPADAVVGDLDPDPALAGVTATVTRAAACLAVLMRASAHTKSPRISRDPGRPDG